jgi:carbonic anhydrase
MKRVTIYSIVAVASLLLTTGCSHTETHAKESHAEHWGYTTDVGPSHWSELNKQYHMCSEGKFQSPINIVATSDIDLPALALDYKTDSTDVIDNGHAVQVNITSGSTFTIGSDKYELKQFHFHTPSENNINAKSFPLEAHFVHATADGKLAVVAVMFEEGEANPILSKIWGNFPLKTGEKVEFKLNSNDVKALMPTDKDYYKFTGSLTTPPCSEEVKWHVIKKPQTISKEQVKEFFDIYGHTNNRAIQDTNKREIEE